jgi:hypothetical protein
MRPWQPLKLRNASNAIALRVDQFGHFRTIEQLSEGRAALADF